MVVSTSNLVEIFIVRGETRDTPSRSVGQVDGRINMADIQHIECNKKASIRGQDSAPPISGGTYRRRRTFLIDGYLESPFPTACLL